MSLKSKLLLLLFFTILFLLVSNLVEQYYIIFPSFVSLEEREAEKDNARIHQAISNELAHLDMLCGDWAIWDDSYEFIQDGNEEYIESNLELNTLISAKLNLVLYVNKEKKVIFKRFYDLEKSFDITFVDDDLNKLVDIVLGDTSKPLETVDGILPLSQGPLMISSRPIFTSEGKGPATGCIVMGRLFSKSVLYSIKDQTDVEFRFFPDTLKTVHEPKTVIVQSSKDMLTMHGTYQSLENAIAYVVETNYVREITRRGLHSILIGELLFSISALILVIILFGITQNSVIRPLKTMSEITMQIRTTGDFSMRIPRLVKNEIGSLASAFNLLLEKIEQQTFALQEANSNLNVLARMDGLTGLYNRRTLDESLKSEWNRLLRGRKPLTVMLCDVDNFKKYNDFFGHQKGDDALKAVADVLKKATLRSADGTFRYGGEEFCVVLPDTDSAGAVTVAERIRSAVEQLKIPHVPSLGDSVVTISLGFSTKIPSEHESLNEILSESDEALYEAKRQGRNCVVAFSDFLRGKGNSQDIS